MKSQNEQIMNLKNLRLKNPLIVDRLYDETKNFCVNCGLRFSNDEYSSHLDLEYKINRAKKKKVHTENIGRFLSIDEWVQGAKTDTFGEIEENTHKQEKELQVTFCEQQKTCKVCEEDFDIMWNIEESVWVFRNAVILKWDDNQSAFPVSYTHLTLPTICSV